MDTEPKMPYGSEVDRAREVGDKKAPKLTPTARFIAKYEPDDFNFTFSSMLGEVISEHTGRRVYNQRFDVFHGSEKT
jgi:hypothetical protein